MAVVTALLLSFLAAVNGEKYLKSSCDGGDTKWNDQVVGAHLRYWLNSIEVDFEQPSIGYIVKSKHNVTNPKAKEVQSRLDFIVKTEPKSGTPVGNAWKNFGYRGPRHHDGFLYGKLDEKQEMSGERIAFIYPDFETALLGKFQNGTMIAAKPTKIIGERCWKGLKKLKFARPRKSAPVLKYQRPNHIRPGDQPNVADPFERNMVYIGPGVAQDGIFARKDINQGELICYYSGVMFDPRRNPIFFRNQTLYQRYSAHRNLIGLGVDESGSRLQINIPEEYWNSTNYRATLGHKVNHDFIKAKSTYNWASHPRFGWIRTVTATEDIYKDEEIFINYHYPIRVDVNVPLWYKELYEDQVGAWPKAKNGQESGVTF